MTQAKWRQLTDGPLTVAAIVFLVAYSYQVIADLSFAEDGIIDSIMWATWALFAIDFVVSLWLAERRWHWFFTHFHEFLIVVLPVLRPLRLLRLITLLAVLQRFAGRALRGRVLIYAAGASVILVYVAALAMLEVERPAAGSTIKTLGDAMWWAAVTITTVGYGDVSPVTLEGRLIAVGVMIAGIALIGTVTATLASFFIDRVADTAKVESDETQLELRALTDEIAELRRDCTTSEARHNRCTSEQPCSQQPRSGRPTSDPPSDRSGPPQRPSARGPPLRPRNPGHPAARPPAPGPAS